VIQPRDDESREREERGAERYLCVRLPRAPAFEMVGGACEGKRRRSPGVEKGCLRVPLPNGSAPRVGTTVAALSLAPHVVIWPHRAGAEARPRSHQGRHDVGGDRTAWSTCQGGPHASCDGLPAWWWARGALVISSSGPPAPRSDSLDALDRREGAARGGRKRILSALLARGAGLVEALVRGPARLAGHVTPPLRASGAGKNQRARWTWTRQLAAHLHLCGGPVAAVDDAVVCHFWWKLPLYSVTAMVFCSWSSRFSSLY
jgi:hypothetical protein